MALTNNQYRQIMRSYDERQLQNRHLMTRRQEEVYHEIPELAKLDRQTADLSMEQARRLIDGDAHAMERLRESFEKLRQKKLQLLTEHHFTADYLEPVYTCADCQDTGYTPDGKKCHCFVQASIDLLYMQSNIRDILEEENFNTFRLDYYSEKTDGKYGYSPLEAANKAVETAKDFIRKFDYEYQNLLLCGNPGVGKTFLTNCIAKELLDHSFSVLYFSASQLFEELANVTFQKNEDKNSTIHDDTAFCDLLIIDDLGTELTNSFIASALFTCLNERHLRKKATIISTNLSLKDIRDKYSERISSRLSLNYKLIKLFGDDIRVKKRLSILS